MPASLSNGLFISEFLGDNAGGGAFDTDGDGGANKADEFVEIQNFTSSAIDLDGVQIWSAKRGLLYEFQSGDVIAANGTATVVGQYDGAEPPGYYDAGLPDNNSNQGFLEDGEASRFDTLYLVDTTTGEYVALAYGDPPQAQPLPSGFTGTTLMGSESINSDLPNSVAIARDTNGDLIENPTPTPNDPGPVCFLAGTLIETGAGPVPIERIIVGMTIRTLDHGLQPVRWIGRSAIPASRLRREPRLAPVRIAAGALGAGLPRRDLWVSPQHRVLVQSRISARMFGSAGVLVPAIKLTGLPGVTQDHRTGKVTYLHLLCDRHEVVLAEGCPAETLYLGPVAKDRLMAEGVAEIAALFPALFAEPGDAPAMRPAAARPFPRGPKLRRLIERHRANGDRRLLECGPLQGLRRA